MWNHLGATKNDLSQHFRWKYLLIIQVYFFSSLWSESKRKHYFVLHFFALQFSQFSIKTFWGKNEVPSKYICKSGCENHEIFEVISLYREIEAMASKSFTCTSIWKKKKMFEHDLPWANSTAANALCSI